ncbi:distal membrane-arm assembly complex protein 1 isoform X1 [Monodelphis domestica]|uniref:distal membrane-arm assembly complex protein 1 isoform X1 n=1 Tax=Monodelphis domestica TaxID=13616 RepID=UPI0024E234B7|nr:distal membrane-arm assembly complex protein 1 isoform X1 [Monodelphis domestica]
MAATTSSSPPATPASAPDTAPSKSQLMGGCLSCRLLSGVGLLGAGGHCMLGDGHTGGPCRKSLSCRIKEAIMVIMMKMATSTNQPFIPMDYPATPLDYPDPEDRSKRPSDVPDKNDLALKLWMLVGKMDKVWLHISFSPDLPSHNSE